MIHAGDYRVIESPEAIEWIKKNNFDGFYVQELQEDEEIKNLGVFSSNQIKSAIGNSGEFDPENPDIRYSQRAGSRSKQSWFLGRDDLGNFTFGAGAKAYRYAADVANLVLDKMALKPISTDLSRAMRQMKMEISKAQELTVDVATKLQELPQQEREMISDVIEGELKRGAKPPKRVLELRGGDTVRGPSSRQRPSTSAAPQLPAGPVALPQRATEPLLSCRIGKGSRSDLDARASDCAGF
jgi:hypothetical protein